MKNLLLAGAVLCGITLASPASAQIQVSVNIGVQPSWGPTGYDHVDYYYIPDIQCYYYVPNHQFVYQSGSRWVFANDVPARYRGFDLYHCHKVVINEPRPYLHYADHQRMYDHFRGERDRQDFIRNTNDNRYHDHWHDNRRDRDEDRRYDRGDNDHHDNGRHNGRH